MDHYVDQEQPSEMSNQEFNDVMMNVATAKDIPMLWPRPNNLLSLLTLVYGSDTSRIKRWLDEPTTEVDEYLTTGGLAAQITRLDIFRRAATRSGTTFAILCAETRVLVDEGTEPAPAQSGATAEEKLAKTADEGCAQ